MIPGRVNRFQVMPDRRRARTRASAPSCAAPTTREMLFQVKVVSQAEYDAHMADLEARGQTGQLPTELGRAQLDRSSRASARHGDGAREYRDDRLLASAEWTVAGPRTRAQGRTVVKWVTTTDHKVIGNLYFITLVHLLPASAA